jgi:RimJ/RimL family protein N-acetyltransferase
MHRMDQARIREVQAAWARLLDVPELGRLQVLVREQSPLARPGWVGILWLDDTMTATVPDASLVAPVEAALDGGEPLPLADDADVLGPASLFYPPTAWDAGPAGRAEPVSPADLAALLAATPQEDVAECGIDQVEDGLWGVRAAGEVVAACGYRRWPNGVAHLSVLTHPAHRGAALGVDVARAAVRQALDDGLLPQWRARVAASQALARRIGLVEVGAQLSGRPAADVTAVAPPSTVVGTPPSSD